MVEQNPNNNNHDHGPGKCNCAEEAKQSDPHGDDLFDCILLEDVIGFNQKNEGDIRKTVRK